MINKLAVQNPHTKFEGHTSTSGVACNPKKILFDSIDTGHSLSLVPFLENFDQIKLVKPPKMQEFERLKVKYILFVISFYAYMHA